jgi:hypothetical protein
LELSPPKEPDKEDETPNIGEQLPVLSHEVLRDVVLKEQAPPLQISQLEAVITSQGQRSVYYRQIDLKDVIRPLVAIYCKDAEGNLIRNGVAFKIVLDAAYAFVSCMHVTGRRCFFRHHDTDVFERCEWMVHPARRDISVSVDPSLLKLQLNGAVFKIGPVSRETETQARMHTMNPLNDSLSLVQCIGSYAVDRRRFEHYSDTYKGQCGSPYEVQGSTNYIHTSTDEMTRTNNSEPIDMSDVYLCLNNTLNTTLCNFVTQNPEYDVIEGNYSQINFKRVLSFINIGAPTKRIYQELIPVGTLNTNKINLPNYGETVSTNLAPSMTKIIDPVFFEEHASLVKGKYFYNNPTKQSIDNAEMRLDEIRPFPIEDDSKKISLTYVDRILEVPLSDSCWSFSQTYDHMEKEKGAGFPLAYLGFADRQSFLDWLMLHGYHLDAERLTDTLMDLGPFCRSVGKVEWATISDYLAKKSRTFMIPGAHILLAQLLCYGQGNMNLKNYNWSSYGFNPFKGGVTNMAREFLCNDENGRRKYPIIIAWDVRGYDRKVWLHNVAERRYRFFSANPANAKYLRLARWVSNMLKKSVLIMVNGDICIRVRGNNSGSGMTTANNIEAGFEVLADLLVASFFKKFEYYPTYDLIFEQIVKLYGDDNLCGLMMEFEVMTDKEWLADRLLRFHGLELKELFVYYRPGILDTDLQGCQFLGFRFSRSGDNWLPQWDMSRLLLPVLYTHEHHHKPDIFMQRLFSIYILVYPHYDMWLRYRTFYINVLRYYSEANQNPGSGLALVKAFCRLGAPSKEEMDCFYFGLEDGGPKYSQMNRLLKNNDTVTLFSPEFTYNEQAAEWKVSIRTAGQVNDIFYSVNNDVNFAYNSTLHLVTDAIQDIWPSPSLVDARIDILRNTIPDTKLPYNKIEYSLRQQQLFSKKFRAEPTPGDPKRYSGELRQNPSKVVVPGTKSPYGNENTVNTRSSHMASENVKDPKNGGFNPYGNGQTFSRPLQSTQLQNMEFGFRVEETFEDPISLIPRDYHELKLVESTEDKKELADLLFRYRVTAEDVMLEEQCDLYGQCLKSDGLPDFKALDDEYFLSCASPALDDFDITRSLIDKRELIRHLTSLYNLYGFTFRCRDWFLSDSECRLVHSKSFTTIPLPDRDVNDVLALMCNYPKYRLCATSLGFLYVRGSNKRERTRDNIAVVPKPPVHGTKDEYGNRNWVIKILSFVIQRMGTFNPYGNGQPKGARGAFITKMKAAGLSEKQAQAAWAAGATNQGLRNKSKARGAKSTPVQNRRPKTPGKNASAFDTRPEGPPRKVVTGNMLATLPGSEKFQGVKKDGKYTTKMSPCGMRYLEFLTHPFKVIDGRSSAWFERQAPRDTEDPCIPTFPCSNSRKYWMITRLNGVSSGTTGGFAVMFAPTRLANDHLTTNNRDCAIIITDTLWTGNGSSFPVCDDFTANTPCATGVSAVNINTEFASADLAFGSSQLSRMNVVKYRVVYSGIRFKYIGTQMNLAGTCFMIQTPVHESLSNLSTLNLSQIPGFVEVDITRQWHELSYCPVDEEEYGYKADYCVNAPSFGLNNASMMQTPSLIGHFLGFLVFGSVINSPFAIEVITGYEIIGNGIGGKTPSSSDISAISKIASIITPSNTAIIDRNDAVLEKMVVEQPDTVTQLSKSIGEGAKGVLGGIAKELGNNATKIIPEIIGSLL